MPPAAISLCVALAAAAFVIWAHVTSAFAWLDPISAYIALGLLGAIIAIDLRTLLGR